jgi:hypothetical protein
MTTMQKTSGDPQKDTEIKWRRMKEKGM